MKLDVMQEKLNNGLRTVQGAVSKKTTLPILNGILISTKKNKGIHLIGTDLEIGIETWVETDIKEEGSVVIPANNFIGIIRELPSEMISMDINSDNYRVKINCKNSEFMINGFNPEEYPSLPGIENADVINIEGNKLLDMVREVEFSTASEETQPALTGALMIINNESIKMVSTNTYRLSYSERNIAENIDKKVNIILPGKTLNELSSLLTEDSEVKIQLGKNHCRFEFDNITIISRLIEGEFPNYEQVMPDEYNTLVSVNRDVLQKATRRAAFIARQEANIINLKIIDEDKLIINTMDTDVGSAHEELFIEKEGPEQNINIDADYLLDVLKVIKEENIVLKFIGALNPLLVEREEEEGKFIYLIMPVRSDA